MLIFQNIDDSVINQGRIMHRGTVHASTYSVDYNESVLCLFIFYGKNRKSCSIKVFKDVFNRSNDVYKRGRLCAGPGIEPQISASLARCHTTELTRLINIHQHRLLTVWNFTWTWNPRALCFSKVVHVFFVQLLSSPFFPQAHEKFVHATVNTFNDISQVHRARGHFNYWKWK